MVDPRPDLDRDHPDFFAFEALAPNGHERARAARRASDVAGLGRSVLDPSLTLLRHPDYQRRGLTRAAGIEVVPSDGGVVRDQPTRMPSVSISIYLARCSRSRPASPGQWASASRHAVHRCSGHGVWGPRLVRSKLATGPW